MTISDRREVLEREIHVAETLLKSNVESYSVSDFLPSFNHLVHSTPTFIQEHPRDILTVASIVSHQVWSDEHIVNKIIHYINQGLLIASLVKNK